jgi:hypothetical protein
MKLITLRNDFHDTETRVRVKLEGMGNPVITKSQARRARRALCGIDTCTCCNAIGLRGPQYLPSGAGFETEPDWMGDHYILIDDPRF